jgi:hypothetical protein
MTSTWCNRPHGRSIRLPAVTRSHRLLAGGRSQAGNKGTREQGNEETGTRGQWTVNSSGVPHPRRCHSERSAAKSKNLLFVTFLRLEWETPVEHRIRRYHDLRGRAQGPCILCPIVGARIVSCKRHCNRRFPFNASEVVWEQPTPNRGRGSLTFPDRTP